jgi:CRISPR-associated protein (Cas_Cas02710)
MTPNLFGWEAATWLLIDQWGILLGLVTAAVTLGGLTIAIIKRNDLRRWLTRNRFPAVGGELQQGEWPDGIVFTVSGVDTPGFVIERCRPRRVGFICTRESRAAASEVARVAERAGVTVHGIHEIADPNQPEETRRIATAMLSTMRDSGCRLPAVDLTGGKTPMSLGAFMAAEEHAAISLYVAAEFDQALKAPDMRTARILRISGSSTP